MMELKKMPRVVGCLLCDFRTDEPKEIELFRANGCPKCDSFDYEGTISLTANKKLTPEQLDQLMDLISLQIIEPVDADQEDEDYSSRNVEVTVKEVN